MAEGMKETPMCESYGVLSLPGKTVMILAPIEDPSTAGIVANALRPPGRRSTVRRGKSASPRASEPSASDMRSMQAAIGMRRATSACGTIRVRASATDRER